MNGLCCFSLCPIEENPAKVTELIDILLCASHGIAIEAVQPDRQDHQVLKFSILAMKNQLVPLLTPLHCAIGQERIF